MPPKKSAADVVLAAGVPDQPRNGLGRVPREFKAHRPVGRSIYAVVELTRKDVRFVDELRADVVLMQIASIQIPDDQALIEKIVRETEEGLTGEAVLPFQASSDGQAERRAALQHGILEWCAVENQDARAIWERYFGGDGAPAGPLGADLVHLVEFADHHGIPPADEVPDSGEDDSGDDEPAGAPSEEDDDSDGEDAAEVAQAEDDARHAVASIPGPEWRSPERRDWDEASDGT